MTLNDRVYYLAQALTSAKSAASLGAENVEFTSGLQERMDVAQVQMEVVRAVESHPDMGGEEKGLLLANLNSDLLGLDEVGLGFRFEKGCSTDEDRSYTRTMLDPTGYTRRSCSS